MKLNLEINGKGMILVLLILISLIVSVFAFAGELLRNARPKSIVGLLPGANI